MSRPVSQGRQYTDDEWERVREPFRYYYIEKNMSLKQAAKMMSEVHGFEATLRQWERRIAPEKWNMPKYANREERLRQISDAGKSLLEVSHRGRRRSTASDGRPPLNEDRNLRRFARREISREPRPRARSVNSLMSDDASDQDMGDTSAAPSPAASEMYTLDIQHSTPLPSNDYGTFTESWVNSFPSTQNETIQHIASGDHVEGHRNLSVPQIFFSGPSGDEYHIAPDAIPSQPLAEANSHLPSIHADDNSYYDVPNFSYEPNSLHTNDSTMNDVVKLDTAWVSDTQSTSETFPSFAFDQEPFAAPFSSKGQDSQSQPAVLSETQAFDDPDLALHQQPMATAAPEEELPDLDNTHTDVHVLLQDHYRFTSQMIAQCLQGCQNIETNDYLLKEGFLSRLKLLQNAIEAQNHETDLNIRNTLKNISTVQRRANRSVYELSQQRKKQVAQLKSQVALLTEPQGVNVMAAYSYG